MEEIIIAKLTTGETVIGKESIQNEYLHDVFLVMMHPNEMGSMGVTLVPYMVPFTDKGATIDVKHIVSTIECPAEFEASYIRATTGLIMPSNKLEL